MILTGTDRSIDDGNGIYETGVESPISYVVITLLGPDKTMEDRSTVTITASPSPPPVGGEWVPIEKFRLLAPWISLGSLIIVTVLLVRTRRKMQRN